MSPLRKRQDGPQDEGARARKALDRATATLQHYQRSGLTVVAIEDVLSLLGDPPQQAAIREPARDPRADPLTGALWAGAPGSLPPGH